MTNQLQPPFRNEKQKRVFDKLSKLVGPGIAEYFKDACSIEQTDTYSTKTHIVSHLMREIVSSIHNILKPKKKEKCPKSNNEAEGIVHEIFQLLGIKDEELLENWRNICKSVPGLAHRDTLDQPRKADKEFFKIWDDFANILNVLLEAFEKKYLIIFSLLDRLVSLEDPNNNDVSSLRNNIPNNLVALGEFFQKCENPKWLALKDFTKLFKNPPESNDSTFWPQSLYLKRMAPKVPDQVLKYIQEISNKTDNWRIHIDLVEAAIQMPPRLAAKWIGEESVWITKQESIFNLLAHKYGVLIKNLTNGNETDSALFLARSVLRVLPDQRIGKAINRIESPYFTPEPHALFDSWHYREIVEKPIQLLAEKEGERTLVLLCDLLESVILLSKRSEEDICPDKYFYIFRPAIESQSKRQDDLYNILITGVRDCARCLVEKKQKAIRDVIKILEARLFKTFKRISIYLLSEFPDGTPDLVVSCLVDKNNFGEVSILHEYALLIGKYFSKLTHEQREKIFDWIKEGPDKEIFKIVQKRETGRAPSDKAIEDYSKAWQRRKLYLIRDHLSGYWKDKYQSLIQEYGVPEHGDYASTSFTWSWGPKSPVNSEELSRLSNHQIFEYLKKWKPSRDDHDNTSEGLSRELSTAVRNEPERFALVSESFKDLDPTYIRALVVGLREAIEDKKDLNWEPIIKLCKWVILQPPVIEGRSENCFDADPNRTWSWKEMASLFRKAFASNSMPYEVRYDAFEIIRYLTEKTDSTLINERYNEDTIIDYYTNSINTVRGEAMNAVFEYAFWVRRNLEELPDSKERIRNGLGEMPEVREILEKHLEVTNEPYYTIRSIYGYWLTSLVVLDGKWVNRNLNRIFPESEDKRKYYRTAWDSYIMYCRPYIKPNMLTILRFAYNYAVDHLKPEAEEKGILRDPERNLAGHLMSFYLWGVISFVDKDEIFAKFFRNASAEIRGHAMHFAGESLIRTPGKLKQEHYKRLKTLWEIRLSAAKKSNNPTKYKYEMRAFSLWFESQKFDEKWSLDQLHESLAIARKVPFDEKIIELLVEIVIRWPKETVLCLKDLAEGDEEGWRIPHWKKQARKILETALQVKDPEVVRVSLELVNYLGLRGYRDEFQELWEKNKHVLN